LKDRDIWNEERVDPALSLVMGKQKGALGVKVRRM